MSLLLMSTMMAALCVGHKSVSSTRIMDELSSSTCVARRIRQHPSIVGWNKSCCCSSTLATSATTTRLYRSWSRIKRCNNLIICITLLLQVHLRARALVFSRAGKLDLLLSCCCPCCPCCCPCCCCCCCCCCYRVAAAAAAPAAAAAADADAATAAALAAPAAAAAAADAADAAPAAAAAVSGCCCWSWWRRSLCVCSDANAGSRRTASSYLNSARCGWISYLLHHSIYWNKLHAAAAIAAMELPSECSCYQCRSRATR